MQRFHGLPRVLTLSGLFLVLASHAVAQECPAVPGTDWTYVNATDNLIEAAVALGICTPADYAYCQKADQHLSITSHILTSILNYNLTFVGGARCLKDCFLDRAIRVAFILADLNSDLQAKSGMYRRYDSTLEILRQWRDTPWCSTLLGVPPPGPGVAPPVPPVPGAPPPVPGVAPPAPGVAPPAPGVAPPAPTPSWRFAGSVLISPPGGRNRWEGQNGSVDLIFISDRGEWDRTLTRKFAGRVVETLNATIDMVTPPPSGTIVAGTNYPFWLIGEVSGYVLPPGRSSIEMPGFIECVEGCTLRDVATGVVAGRQEFILNDTFTTFDLDLEIIPTAAPDREIKIQFQVRAGAVVSNMEWIYVPY